MLAITSDIILGIALVMAAKIATPIIAPTPVAIKYFNADLSTIFFLLLIQLLDCCWILPPACYSDGVQIRSWTVDCHLWMVPGKMEPSKDDIQLLCGIFSPVEIHQTPLTHVKQAFRILPEMDSSNLFYFFNYYYFYSFRRKVAGGCD
jgi:hypothetical protein